MEIVGGVFVGAVVTLVIVLFVWSNVRAIRGSRHRAPLRDASAVPEGFALGIRETEAMRAPFALILRGNVVDVAQTMTGEFRGAQVGVTDLTLLHSPDGTPMNHTLVTLDVDWRWPWMRLRRADVDGPVVELESRRLDDGRGWLLEAADTELAAALVTPELLAWLARGDLPIQVETTPRHLLVAVAQHVPDAGLQALIDLVTGIVDHVPSAVKAAITPPRPEDDV